MKIQDFLDFGIVLFLSGVVNSLPNVLKTLPVFALFFPFDKKSNHRIKLTVIEYPIRIEPVAGGVLVNEFEVVVLV